MAHMTLPSEHSEADALLAERIGQTLELHEIHVFLTLPSARRAATEQQEPASPRRIFGAIAALGAALGRIVAPRR